MRPRPTWIRIWRDRDYQVFHALIDGSEAEALKQMIRGEPFAAICDAYADLPEEQAAREAIATLSLWLERGLVVRAEITRRKLMSGPVAEN